MCRACENRVQVSKSMHVDDLFVTCYKQDRIMELATSLRERYGGD